MPGMGDAIEEERIREERQNNKGESEYASMASVGSALQSVSGSLSEAALSNCNGSTAGGGVNLAPDDSESTWGGPTKSSYSTSPTSSTFYESTARSARRASSVYSNNTARFHKEGAYKPSTLDRVQNQIDRAKAQAKESLVASKNCDSDYESDAEFEL